MVVYSANEAVQAISDHQNYDRNKDLIAFDETKAGVKGLVDAGITEIPRIFIQPVEQSFDTSELDSSIPVFDLSCIDKDAFHRQKIVEKVREASETWGFFQVVNHGIPISTLEEMKNGVLRFYEQDTEVKKQWYTRDSMKKRFVYNSNFDLFRTPYVNWRDTAYCSMAPSPLNPEELPEACRDIMVEYSKHVRELGYSLFGLLSEALGLQENYLVDLGCAEGHALLLHYYPACPQPELTLGTAKHADSGFVTVLLQDHVGGLQVLHENRWIDVPSVPGAVVVNVGDLLQLITNGKFKSVEHRVLANHVGPRVSVACFFTTGFLPSSKIFGPIEELLSPEEPPKYKPVTVKEFTAYYNAKGLDGNSALSHFRI